MNPLLKKIYEEKTIEELEELYDKDRLEIAGMDVTFCNLRTMEKEAKELRDYIRERKERQTKK